MSRTSTARGTAARVPPSLALASNEQVTRRFVMWRDRRRQAALEGTHLPETSTGSNEPWVQIERRVRARARSRSRRRSQPQRGPRSPVRPSTPAGEQGGRFGERQLPAAPITRCRGGVWCAPVGSGVLQAERARRPTGDAERLRRRARSAAAVRVVVELPRQAQRLPAPVERVQLLAPEDISRFVPRSWTRMSFTVPIGCVLMMPSG